MKQQNRDYLKIASGASINLMGMAVRSFLGFTFTVVISRSLPLPQLGLYTMGSAAATLSVYICVMGMDSGLWRHVSAYQAKRQWTALKSSIATALLVAVSLSIAVSAVLMVSSLTLVRKLEDADSIAGVLQTFALTIPMLAVTRIFNAATQGMQIMKYTAIRDICEPGLRLLLTIVLFIIGLRLAGALLANLLAIAIVTAVSLIFLRRAMRRLPSCESLCGPTNNEINPSKERERRRAFLISTKQYLSPFYGARGFIQYSIPMGFSLIFTHLLLWNDTFFLGYFRGADDAGLYVVAVKMVNTGAIVFFSLNTVLAPVISGLHALGRPAEIERLFKTATRWALILSLPYFLPLIFFGGPALLIFGEKFNVVAVNLAILATGQLINIATGPAGAIISMRGHPRMETVNCAIAWMVSAGLCSLLIPRFGAIAAAGVNAVVTGSVNLVRVLEVRLIFGIYAFGPGVLKIAAAGLIAGGFAFATIKVFASVSLLTLVITLAMFQTVYWLIVYRFCLEKHDREVTHMLGVRLRKLLPTQVFKSAG